MRIFLPVGIGLCLFFISITYYARTHSFPHTYIALAKISGKTQPELKNTLTSLIHNPIRIAIKDRVYEYTYNNLGVIMQTDKTIETAFEQNTQPLPRRLSHFFQSLQSNTMYLPDFLFTQDFYRFADKTIYDLSYKEDQVVVDNISKKLVLEQNDERYKIDPESLKSQIIFNFGKKDVILRPVLVQVESDAKKKVLGKNTILGDVFDNPITIILEQENDHTRFTLLPDQLKQLINVSYQQDKDLLGITILDEPFQTMLTNMQSSLHITADKRISSQKLKDDLVNIIQERSKGTHSDTVLAKVELVPNSTGNLAKKYIEVDLSQQMMYLFHDGHMVKTYKVSSGLQYPTPIGQFKILNKASNAYSDIYHVWMPYWMAFNYAKDVNAYLGIHELPYWVADGGQKIQRPREFIGSPHTGGCIALDVGAASEVYAFADIGMPVYVYN